MEKDVHKEDDIPGLERKAHMKVPAGYFDELPNRIMAKIPEAPARRVVWWQQWTFWRVAAPAFMAVVIALVYLLQPEGAATGSDGLLAEVSEDALIAYLDAELDPEDVLYYDLAYVEDAEAVDETLWDDQLDDDPVEDYLDEMSLDDLSEFDLDDISLDL